MAKPSKNDSRILRGNWTLGVRLGVLLLYIAVVRSAVALPDYLSLFERTYQPRDLLGAASCRTCHTDVPQRNPYGAALASAIRAEGAERLTVEILRSVENDDSDQDGWANGTEITIGTLPGDAGNQPRRHSVLEPTRDSSPGTAEPEKTSVSKPVPVVPTHSFHPLVVHFPIALFIFGAMLEGLGIWRKEDTLRRAGYWNMLGGAVSTAIVLPTGFAAALRVGFPLEAGSQAFLHMSAALASTGLMIWVVASNRKSRPPSRFYVVLLLVATFTVGWTGHLGAILVYGP